MSPRAEEPWRRHLSSRLCSQHRILRTRQCSWPRDAEEAIQPGRRALDLDPTSAHAYTAWARSHLLAACAQGCAARESLRTEKRKEKSLGRRSQLEVREEEQRRAQEQRQSGKRPSTLDRSTLRAGAMWRIMEAGRLWKQGAAAEPNSEEAQLFHRRSKLPACAGQVWDARHAAGDHLWRVQTFFRPESGRPLVRQEALQV